MSDINKLVRENVKRLVPYSSARDDYSGRTGIFLDANENPRGSLNRYPDPYQKELKRAISDFREVPVENIFLGNGSDEIIDLCFRTFCNPGHDKAMIFPPTYGMYEVSAAINDVHLVKVPLDERFQIDSARVIPELGEKDLKLVIICSPNNPTGNLMDRKDITSILSLFKGIVVIDEAYIDFSSARSFKEMTGSIPNLIVMQTLSKAAGMASVRIGMAFTSPEIVSLFNKMKPPYNISTVNQKTAINRLKHTTLLTNQLRMIKSERTRLLRNLGKLSIIDRVFPSDANFVLTTTKDADGVYSALVSRGIIVRNRNSAVPGAIRITVGTRKENDMLLDALKKISL
jgi:histidinol-phosphate aminotransferase